MTNDLWLGLALVGVVAVLAAYGLRGGRLLLPQDRRFVCPVFDRIVECRAVRDVRTGQWKHVESCTAFADPMAVRCDEKCTAAMNLGFPLEGEGGRP